MNRKSFHRAGLLAAFLFIFTAGQLRAELPPDAQEAMKKGIIAAKQQDYLLAIRYFQDARIIQDSYRDKPDAPEIYYNLGLAESKIPGRELRSICWFEAYLATTTNAPNATAVKGQIDELDVKSQINISHLIQTAQDVAMNIQIGQDDMFYTKQYIFNNAVYGVVDMWGHSGDFVAAQNAISLLQTNNDIYDFKSKAERNIAQAQVQFTNSKTNYYYSGDITSFHEWTVRVDEYKYTTHWGELNEPVFLDLSRRLKSLPPSDNPKTYFTALKQIAYDEIDAQRDIDYMLKILAKQQAKP